MDFDIKIDKRIHKPKIIRSYKERQIKYDNAEKCAQEITLEKNIRIFSFISGNFIFGDLIEAICVKHDYYVKQMTITTLSMSYENIESLKNLLHDKYVNKLNLIVSDYFYSHERTKMIPDIYKKLDYEDRFQLSVARIHSKICIFETYCGMKIVFHGSANLRSSDNIEQFDIEENETLYDYIDEFLSKIIDKYRTINKSIGGKKLWQVVTEENQEAQEEKEQGKQQSVGGDLGQQQTQRHFKPKF